MNNKTLIFLLLCAALLVTGCSERRANTSNKAKATAWQQQYKAACQAKETDRALAIIDSMEQAKVVSTAKGDYLRAMAYDQGWQMQIAEHYYREAYEAYSEDPAQDWYVYGDAGYRFAYLRANRGDTDGALSVISALLTQAEENEAFSKDVETSLLMLMADIQIELSQVDEAKLNWHRAYELHQQVRDANPDKKADLPWLTLTIFGNLLDLGDLTGAQEWLDRSAQEFAAFEQVCTDSLLLEEWRGHLALQRARYLQRAGHTAEAAAAFAAVPRSRIFEPHGYTAAADYLMASGRYDEAAYWYEQLDSTYLATDGARMTFDNIASRLAPRYTAYRKAGRNADALVIADSVSVAIDSALIWQRKSDAAELAVIYQTHEKDLQLTKLNFTVYLHRLLAVTLLVILLLIGYLLWRTYRYNRELTAKNRRLVEEIEQREREEQLAIEQLKAEPVESLTAQQQLFRRICDLMDSPDRIYTDTGLDRVRLAQLIGTNEHYVSDAINACTGGKSVNGFLNEYRLRYAAHLLATTKDPVALIAELSGFSRSSFFRIFSDAYGMSPSEYRGVVGK